MDKKSHKEKKNYNDTVVINGVIRESEKDIETYYDVDLDMLYHLNEKRIKKQSQSKQEDSRSINSYIEQQLRAGVTEAEVRKQLSSYLRTINHNRRVITNTEEREVYDRLTKRLANEEKRIELLTFMEFFLQTPGALPGNVDEETLKNAAYFYADAIVSATPKEKANFIEKLDYMLLTQNRRRNAVIVFRKCLDMEISDLIVDGTSREDIKKLIAKRLQDFQDSNKAPYSQETITRAIVLAKIDNYEKGEVTYLEEQDRLTVAEQLKIIKANIIAREKEQKISNSKGK